MNDYILYRRRSLSGDRDVAWQLNKGGRAFESVPNGKIMNLSEFAAFVALRSESPICERIWPSDRLTTITSVLTPENNYIDESASAEELTEFWQAYSVALENKR